MKTYDELLSRWNSCQGGQILVDHTHPLKMYLNINNNGNKELLVPVSKPIIKFQQTEAIGISNYKYGSVFLFSIELLSEKLTEEYVCLCFDLIESSRPFETVKESSAKFFDTFSKWYSLWTSVRGDILPINEIRGLMGELMYMVNETDAGSDSSKVINSWTIHKDASRDFIYDCNWDEVKTIQTSGDYVTISSLEQLEHDSDGRLVVYRLDCADVEKDFDTYTLNSLVGTLKSKLDLQTETELTRKLLAKGYSYNKAYETYVFKFNKKSCYIVNESFPRIDRSTVPDAICSVKYDILLRQIENWREE